MNIKDLRVVDHLTLRDTEHQEIIHRIRIDREFVNFNTLFQSGGYHRDRFRRCRGTALHIVGQHVICSSAHRVVARTYCAIDRIIVQVPLDRVRIGGAEFAIHLQNVWHWAVHRATQLRAVDVAIVGHTDQRAVN